MISYSIDKAKKSGLFNEIMVSTDNEEIASISKKYGATVPFMRSKKNADAHATLSDVITEVLDQYRELHKRFLYVCCILPTAPLLSLKNLKKGFEFMQTGKYDSVRPVVRFSYPVQRAFRLEEGYAEFINPQYSRTRSQDLPPAFHDAGQFYWFKFEKGMIPSKRGAFEISEMEAQDIDTPDDLRIAELKYTLLTH